MSITEKVQHQKIHTPKNRVKFKKKILQNSQKISKKNGVKFTKIQKKNIV